ncbi:MAG: dehydrogenase (quinone) [Peptococcaceae bacterium]|jgi:multicomponent Na+:H+ antiporter subunit D|uniref:Monovalent cation/H+ antiporter subunit D family protein n=1 Tax=Thermanaerosceptrum fracticalcis TaxID=1712410 RepID=A0A7G6E4Q8_THEFR|nr:monovalent cation/H+ antiporter subunit D family protein [Thermanaerosceptrum fracticalcis]MBZ4654698.1 dehydrogenase (quinone) [Peptococcaceae bacterium]QNB47062.1 monovalent cation/H+ antiporter subunit D family protein [Thermanaerosceptrum fracticalcis]
MAVDFVLDYRPLWAVLISMVAAGLILLSGRHPNLRESWTILAAFGKAAIVYSMLPTVLAGTVLETTPLNIAKGISLHLRVDTMGMLFAALASALWVVTSFYSIGYMRELDEKHQTGYFASFAVCLSATMGIAFAANLLTFFVFYEILTIATYPLVIHKRNEEAINSGRKYLVYTLVAGQLLLIGIIWTQLLAGSGDFQAGGFLAGKASVGVLQTIFVLMIIGTAVKAGVMPLHGWLPAAMVAPTPVSALLHAVAVVKAGAFGILRVIGFVFGPKLLAEIGVATFLAWVAAFTIIVSSLIALAQDNLKRRLAFSTVGQLSYVVLGASLLTPLGFLGGMYHIIAHAFMKITLFFCAGAVYATHHISNVSEMRGIGRKMPFTMGAFAVGSLGIAGLPFLVGFISKWNIALGALQGGQGIFVAVLIGSAMLSSAYFLPIVYMAFFKEPEEMTHHGDHHGQHGEANLAMLIPLVITAVFSLILGVLPNAGGSFYDLAVMTAKSIVGGNLMGGGW